MWEILLDHCMDIQLLKSVYGGKKQKRGFPDQCESRMNNQIQTTKLFKEFWGSSLCKWIKSEHTQQEISVQINCQFLNKENHLLFFQANIFWLKPLVNWIPLSSLSNQTKRLLFLLLFLAIKHFLWVCFTEGFSSLYCRMMCLCI